jgi:hypothetical protein
MTSEPDREDKAAPDGEGPQPQEQQQWRQGWVTVDPSKPLYGRVHACVLLRKVNDAMHGDSVAMPALDDEYVP